MTKQIEKPKLYFKNVDATFCLPLESHIHDARIEGFDKITLVEAIPDDSTNDFIWCTHFGECVEVSDCKKSRCDQYSSKSGRGKCINKGNLYLHGEEVEFIVNDFQDLNHKEEQK